VIIDALTRKNLQAAQRKFRNHSKAEYRAAYLVVLGQRKYAENVERVEALRDARNLLRDPDALVRFCAAQRLRDFHALAPKVLKNERSESTSELRLCAKKEKNSNVRAVMESALRELKFDDD